MNINERLKHKDVHPSVSLYSSYYFQMAQCLNILVEGTLLLLGFQHDYVSKDLNIFKTAWDCLNNYSIDIINKNCFETILKC